MNDAQQSRDRMFVTAHCRSLSILNLGAVAQLRRQSRSSTECSAGGSTHSSSYLCVLEQETETQVGPNDPDDDTLHY